MTILTSINVESLTTMRNQTRRNFFRDVELGAVALSLPAQRASSTQMPGRPPAGTAASPVTGQSSIMAIAAHPGDAFFAMGAPVALQVRLGGQGSFLSLSLGEKGSSTIPPAHYGILQREASQRAAAMLSARASFLTYPDGQIPVNDEAKFAVCDLIRAYKPDVVVTHWRGSWHKDHKACYEIVNDAVFYAALPAILRKQPAHAVAKLFFADNWEDADGFKADTYLDITPVFQHWIDACAAFPMWRGENGFRYNDYYGSLAIERGCLSGSKYAVALMSPPEQLTRHVRAL
jgi:N-acetylglucosamine malate deacetylase 1